MFKTLFKMLCFIWMLGAGHCWAQHKYLLKYFTHHDEVPVYYRSVASVLHPDPEEDMVLPDTLDVEFRSVRDIQKLIDKGFHRKVVGIRLNIDSANLPEAIGLLKRYKRLRVISFYEEFGHVSRVSLPANIKDLQQVEGVKLPFGAQNINDALLKLSELKKLYAISGIDGYHLKPSVLLQLKNIRIIPLNAAIVNDLDIGHVKWEAVFFEGALEKQDRVVAALTKLSKIPTLKNLEISGCDLGRDGTPIIGNFKQLRSLKLNFVKVGNSQIFDQVSRLDRLTALSVKAFNDSTQTTAGLEKLTRLQVLDIQNMPDLARTPDVYSRLSRLKVLYITACKLDHIPLNIFQLKQLEHLRVYSSQLTTLPRGKYQSKKLKSILINYSKLTSVPDELLGLTALEDINLATNQISSIPAHGWEKLTRLKHLDLNENSITVFPGGVEQLTGLISLDLSRNQISKIPDPLDKNYQLRTLNIGFNNIRMLPEHIGNYDQLNLLDVGQNKITGLPASLSKCTKLTRFYH